MVAFLAAIPGIISAISGAAELFDAGKQIFEDVTGKPSQAKSPEEFGKEIEALPPGQAEKVVELVLARVEQHKAETARIMGDQGEVSADILRLLPEDKRWKFVWVRMLARPRLVLRMSHVFLAPFYVAAGDYFLMLVNGIARWRGWRPVEVLEPDGRVRVENYPIFDLFAEKMFADGSIYATIYSWVAPAAATVVVSYILGRTWEKVAETGGLAGVKSAVGRVVGGLKGVFGGGGK